jgi:hypothetical protein
MNFFKRAALLLGLFAAASSTLSAQDDVNKLLQESVDDGEKLIGAYISPFMKSISSGMNQGWYNTAKPHKIAGFDLTFTVNAMNIPKDQMFFKPADLGLEKIELDPSSPDKPNAPTIFGPEREPTFRLKDENSQTFTGPGGLDMKKNIGLNALPVPMAHLAFGLPKGTDLKIRFVPKIALGDDGQLNMFGIGIMHDVKQWIPGIKNMPFDLSGFVGYTKFKMEMGFDEDNVENGKGVFQMNATTIQGVISKKVSVLTVYGGLGYNIAKSNLDMLGTYTISNGFDQIDNTPDDVKVVNPVQLDFAASGPRVTAGFRLKLAIFTLQADYTLQKYSCMSFGFGFNVR